MKFLFRSTKKPEESLEKTQSEFVEDLLGPSVRRKAFDWVGLGNWSRPIPEARLPFIGESEVFILETRLANSEKVAEEAIPRVWCAYWWGTRHTTIWGTNVPLSDPEALCFESLDAFTEHIRKIIEWLKLGEAKGLHLEQD